jgi:hypothetical protein
MDDNELKEFATDFTNDIESNVTVPPVVKKNAVEFPRLTHKDIQGHVSILRRIFNECGHDLDELCKESIILFTDGHENNGNAYGHVICAPTELAEWKRCKWIESDVVLSTYAISIDDVDGLPTGYHYQSTGFNDMVNLRNGTDVVDPITNVIEDDSITDKSITVIDDVVIDTTGSVVADVESGDGSASEVFKIISIIGDMYQEDREAFLTKFRQFYTEYKTYAKVRENATTKEARSRLYQAVNLFTKASTNSSYTNAYKYATEHHKVPVKALKSVIAAKNRSKKCPV